MDKKDLTGIEKEMVCGNVPLKYSTLIRYKDGLKSNKNRNYDFAKAIVLSTLDEGIQFLNDNSIFTDIPEDGIVFEPLEKDTLIILGKDKTRSYHSDEGISKIQVETNQIKVYEHREEDLPTYLNLNGRRSSSNYEFFTKQK